MAASIAPSEPMEAGVDGSQGAPASHLEITDSGDAFNVRAELHSFDLPGPTASTAAAEAAQVQAMRAPRKTRKKANPVLRAIDLLADADRENITATLRGGMLEVKMPKGRMESLAAARSALLASVVSGRPRGA
ncbi:MAG TPA: Hsp20/alpha crystallin family protein [Terriglobia bacterium]|nr:Hsp20/alpha crystallin family protein [Terriglobia bacterium]